MSDSTSNPADAAAFCISCGRSISGSEILNVRGSVYCEPCLANVVQAQARKVKVDASGGTSPGAAFALGLIPGVGAIYNGEFVKAAIHIVTFGLLVSLADAVQGSAEPLFGMLSFGFYVYMPFEAYYSAKKRKMRLEGIELETPIDRLQEQFGNFQQKELAAGVVLIAFGTLFFLDTLDVMSFSAISRLWPLAFIGAGIWLLVNKKGKAA